MEEPIRIASAQYPVDFITEWFQYEKKISDMITEAVDNRAQILLFPEYACMELTSLFPDESDLYRQLESMQSLLGDYLNIFRKLSKKHTVFISAGTFPVRAEDTLFRNRSWFFFPDEKTEYQDKRILTRFEKEKWGITGIADQIKVFRTCLGTIGVNICYDAEFPLMARTQAEAGAEIILVPSCTDTLSGFYRVQIGCRARALENQCFVIQSPLVGNADWSDAIDVNIGAAGVYMPPVNGYCEEGILSIGEMNTPGWVYADLNRSILHEQRKNGTVLNFKDWSTQWDYR